MTRVAHFLVALLVLPLAVACGDDDNYQPPPGGGPVITDEDEKRRKQELREKREAGELLQEGDGYWYVRPRAWRDRTKAFQDLIPFLDDAINERVENELVAQLITTTILPAGRYIDGPFADRQAEFARHMRRIATEVDRKRMTTVDRKEAIHLTGVARHGAFEAQLDQFIVISGSELYTITFKLDVDNPERQRERLIQSVLDSWHWTD